MLINIRGNVILVHPRSCPKLHPEVGRICRFVSAYFRVWNGGSPLPKESLPYPRLVWKGAQIPGGGEWFYSLPYPSHSDLPCMGMSVWGPESLPAAGGGGSQKSQNVIPIIPLGSHRLTSSRTTHSWYTMQRGLCLFWKIEKVIFPLEKLQEKNCNEINKYFFTEN